jgi:IclR family transcriptional regulator, pca regulon regulatory protein
MAKKTTEGGKAAGKRKAQPARSQRPADPKASKSSVLSLAKGFRVLEAFSGEIEELTLSEIADVADLDAGTAFRMLNTLVDLAYIARVPDTKRFRLTLKVLDLGFNAIAHKDQRALVRPVLQSLVDEISEAASYGVLDGGDVLYIERVRAGFTRLGVDIRIGTTIPVAISAIGAAILAFLPPETLARTLAIEARHPLAVRPPDRNELATILEGVRRHGYIIKESLISGGLHILAAPVLDSDGYSIGAISVAAPMIRVTDQQLLDRSLAHVLAATKDIARALEASGSTSP